MRQQQREVFVVPPPNTADVGRPRPFNRSPLAHKHDGCVMCRATVLLSAGMRTAPSAWCFLHGVRFVLHGGSGSSLWCRLDGWLLHRLLRSTAFMYNENCLSTTLLASNKCLLAAGTACRPWQCVRVGTPSHSPCSSTLAGMHQGVAYSKTHPLQHIMSGGRLLWCLYSSLLHSSCRMVSNHDKLSFRSQVTGMHCLPASIGCSLLFARCMAMACDR